MNTDYIQTVTDETIKTVSAVFEYEDIMAKRYTYKTRLDFEEGDMAVVNTPHGLSIVEIVEIHDEPEIDPDSVIDFKWIVQKVDIDAIEQAEADDKAFAKKCRERIRANHRKQARVALDGLLGEGFIEEVSEESARTIEDGSDLI